MREDARIMVEEALMAVRVHLTAVLSLTRAAGPADVLAPLERAIADLEDVREYLEEERRART